MTPTLILFAAGLLAGVVFFVFMLLRAGHPGSAIVAALVCAGLLGFTVVTALAEGPLGFVPNHSQSLWGVQVWYDLIIAVAVALFVLAPRAQAVGMAVPAWVALSLLTGSIGLTAFAARVFWLEHRAARTV